MHVSPTQASLLALAGRYDSNNGGTTLTFFASGTGLAGIFGYFWHALFMDWIGFSMTTSLLLANSLALAYSFNYHWFLKEGSQMDDDTIDASLLSEVQSEHSAGYHQEQLDVEQSKAKQDSCDHVRAISVPLSVDTADSFHEELEQSKNLAEWDVHNLTLKQRVRLVLSLWPYMVPLFVVYASEYALQSGAWTAIGFPVQSEKARGHFYQYSNWLYQSGVFLSRSSGTLFRASLPVLWLMPGLQFANLVFFCYTAVYQFWYSWSILILCFFAGILGGGVYVNAFTRISADLPEHQTEFALASASVADSFGIVLGDVLGLFIQSCMYKANDIDGAVASCPF